MITICSIEFEHLYLRAFALFGFGCPPLPPENSNNSLRMLQQQPRYVLQNGMSITVGLFRSWIYADKRV